MDKSVLKNCKVLGEITDIVIKDGIIEKVGKTDLDGIDLGEKKVYPGLFDIHCHGLGGYDTMDGNKLIEMSKLLLKEGTTSWLPTTMTMDFETIKKATDEIPTGDGAEIVGFHMEGPYINEKYKGAQNSIFIKNPDIEEYSHLKNIKMVTIAPELSGSIDFIEKCDAVISIGHTDCTYSEAVSAMAAGAKCLTHTFNAMPPLHHREPGPIGAAIDQNAYVQVISDGIHIHPAIIRTLYRLFGRERLVLISDCMRAGGLPDGIYEFGGMEMTVKDKIARTQSGALAGSTSTLLECVKKAIEFGIPEEDAFYMASATPSNLMKINKGYIKEGFAADLIVLDENLNLTNVIVGGKIK